MSEANDPAVGKPNSATIADQLPEPITKQLAELYAEYIKPKRFFQWVYEQEQLKRNIAKQQLELEHQYAIACLEVEQFRNGWDCQQFIFGNK
jgi:hypothetical protein